MLDRLGGVRGKFERGFTFDDYFQFAPRVWTVEPHSPSARIIPTSKRSRQSSTFASPQTIPPILVSQGKTSVYFDSPSTLFEFLFRDLNSNEVKEWIYEPYDGGA